MLYLILNLCTALQISVTDIFISHKSLLQKLIYYNMINLLLEASYFGVVLSL